MTNIQISVEISMYPLQDNYLESIEEFLHILHTTHNIKVQTNVMSTQVFGPLPLVFDTIKNAIQKIYGDGKQYPFVIKVLNSDVSEMAIKSFK